MTRLKPLTLTEYERAAKLFLSDDAWAYISGGEIDEITVRRNDSAFDELVLRPRHLRDSAAPDLSTTLLGTDVALPVFLSPSAGHRTAHPGAELETVAGAATAGALMIASTETNVPIGQIAASNTAPLWFALHHFSRAITERLVAAAVEAGCRAIVVGIDDPAPHPKHADIRAQYAPPLPFGNIEGLALPAADPSWSASDEPPLTWADLAWIAELSGLPVVVKGVMTPEDARIAVASGASGIIVSNQGGRHLDTTLSTIEVLPEVVAAVGDACEVYLDGGIRRGADVLKALALGARAVGIGRPVLWGLAVDGSTGVAGVLETLRSELHYAAAYTGQRSVTEIDPSTVGVPRSWTEWITAEELRAVLESRNTQ